MGSKKNGIVKLVKYFPLYKTNLRLAFPVVLSQAGQVTVSLADTMMVGHKGTTELAAASFANSVFYLGMVFGIGITLGMTPLVGKAFSQNKEKDVGGYLKNGFFIHAVFALFIAAIMVGVSFFLDSMGQSIEVEKKATPYFLLLVASIFPMLLFFSIKQFFEGIGNTKLAMVITLIANAINIVLNYLLIFGKFGFPELGLIGAGVATLISRSLMPFMLIPFIVKHSKYRSIFRIAYHSKFQLTKIRELLSLGIPIGLQIIVEVLAFSVGAVMMGWLGDEQLAAHQIALGMASFTYMISLGVGSSTTILVSHEFGKQKMLQIRHIVFSSLHIIVLFMSIMGVLIVFLRYYLPYLFTEDQAVIDIAAGLLIIAAMFQVFDGMQVALLSSLRGMSDVKIPMVIAFMSYIVIGVSISYICAFIFEMGAIGIWIGFLIGLIFAAFLFSWRLKKILEINEE